MSKFQKEKLSNTISLPKASPTEQQTIAQKLEKEASKYEEGKYKVVYHTIDTEGSDDYKPSTTKSENIRRIQKEQKKQERKLVSQQARDDGCSFQSSTKRGFEKFTDKELKILDKKQKEMLQFKLQEESKQTTQLVGRLVEYKNNEENLSCLRFPHLSFCGCRINCNQQLNAIDPVKILENLFIGPLETAFQIKKLLALGITHIINASTSEYTKRVKYFKFLTIDVYDNNEEDIKKYFRMTNRFISSAIHEGGKVLIHDKDCTSPAISIALAYFINQEKIPLKNGMEILEKLIPSVEINLYFQKQLEQYDLERLALGGINLKN